MEGEGGAVGEGGVQEWRGRGGLWGKGGVQEGRGRGGAVGGGGGAGDPELLEALKKVFGLN